MNRRFYTREAALVGWDNTTASYTSDDLAATYDATCEYLPHCALATGGSCGDNDRCERTKKRLATLGVIVR